MSLYIYNIYNAYLHIDSRFRRERHSHIHDTRGIFGEAGEYGFGQ